MSEKKFKSEDQFVPNRMRHTYSKVEATDKQQTGWRGPEGFQHSKKAEGMEVKEKNSIQRGKCSQFSNDTGTGQ